MTAEALEKMTDTGKFEILATPVLRELYPFCKNLAHVGVNAAGKTIPNPVDGFCRVPGSNPPRYVLAQFTTIDLKKLREKWLSEPALNTKENRGVARTEGDLIKAAKQAAVILQSEPTAQFTVYLCTNRRPSVELMQEVDIKSGSFGVEVCILEQSQLRDFLDTKPEGQWLRQQYLGINADQLSRSLLRHLGPKSLRAYSTDLLFAETDEIIQTNAGRSAYDAMRDPFSSLHLLIGPSGAGKTVIGQDILRRHLEAGGLGLWIPAEVADRAISLSQAIEDVLHALHPGISKGAGHDALAFAAIDNPLLLIVDDINRSPKTSAILNRIMSWCRSPQTGDTPEAQRKSSIRIVCPLWDSHWYSVRSRLDGSPWLRAQVIGALRRPEAVACLRAALRDAATRFSQAELEEFAEQMKDDAILLGLFGRQSRNRAEISPKALSEDVIGNFVTGIVCELSAETHIPIPDYISALRVLASEMISRRSLYPQWVELGGWFSGRPATLDHIRHLAEHQHVCRIATRERLEQFEFRHDRILEYYLCLAAAEILEGTDAARESISDPFFVPIVGRALARLHASDAVLDWVAKRLPVALIVAIPYLSATNAIPILDRAHVWLMQWPAALRAVQDDAFNTLLAIQSPHVLKITSGIPEHKAVWQARLRNGDAYAGAKVLTKFFPSTDYPWLESLIEEAKFLHLSKLVLELEMTLTASNLDDQVCRGALCLAGYVGDPRLARSVKIAWDKAVNRSTVLADTLWAAFRCADDMPDDLLDPLMPAILAVSDEGPPSSMSDRGYLLQDLAFAFRKGIGDAVLRYLAGLGEAREEYSWVVTALLEKIDHPIAIRYTTRKLAWSKHTAEQTDHFSPFALTWADQWRRRRSGEASGISAASLYELQLLWTNGNNPDWLRTFAFSVWARYVPDLKADPSLLGKAPLGDGTVWHRALRGDPDIVPEVVSRLTVAARWLTVVPRIWCAALEASIEPWFEECKPDGNSWDNLHYDLAHLLRDIPMADGLRLLLKHWERIRLKPMFVQVALYLGTDETRSLAKESLQTGASSEEAFRHIDSFFGFRTEGLSDRLGQCNLEALRPYLAHVDVMCIGEMIEYCNSHDYWHWARRHLEPECRQRVETSMNQDDSEANYIRSVTTNWFPTDQDLLAEFDAFENLEPHHRAPSVWHWLDRLSERRVTLERCFSLLEQWLGNSATPARCLVAAAIVANRGQRSALNILRSHCDRTILRDSRELLSDAEYRVLRRSLY